MPCLVAMGLQVILATLTLVVTRGSALLLIIHLYYPPILLITKLGQFTGESTMMLPVFFGIPLGVMLYGMLFGWMFKLLVRR